MNNSSIPSRKRKDTADQNFHSKQRAFTMISINTPYFVYFSNI